MLRLNRTPQNVALYSYMHDFLRDHDTHVEAFDSLIFNCKFETIALIRQACENIIESIDVAYQCQRDDE